MGAQCQLYHCCSDGMYVPVTVYVGSPAGEWRAGRSGEHWEEDNGGAHGG